jgi:hypothetical protein
VHPKGPGFCPHGHAYDKFGRRGLLHVSGHAIDGNAILRRRRTKALARDGKQSVRRPGRGAKGEGAGCWRRVLGTGAS